MKDPAFLFYSSDFITGTYFMRDEQIGKYIKLLCMQHQKGRLNEKDMLNICKTYDEDIYNKFIKDEEGNYYNKRLEEETIKRKKYSESRRNNRKKKEKEDEKKEDIKNICKTYDKHMGNENENINININNINEEKLQKTFIECINSTNLKAIEECISYLKDLPYEVIEQALIKTSGISRPNWNYAKVILDKWIEHKIDTLEKVKSEELNFKNKEKIEDEMPEWRRKWLEEDD